MAGKAVPRINRMKKMAVMSAMGFVLSFGLYRGYRKEMGKVARFSNTKDTTLARFAKQIVQVQMNIQRI
jgi:hypothetical protein